MLKSRLQAMIGGENLNNSDVTIVTPELVVEQQQDLEIAEAQNDILEAKEDIAQTENDIEALEEKLEDLEEKIDGIESRINGTLPWNAELVQGLFADARKIETRVVGEKAAASLKGAECFTDKDTAQIELMGGMESFKETAGKVWEGIKAFFVRLYKGTIAFFVGLFNQFKGLEKKAENLISRIDGIADDKIKKEITLGAWNNYMSIDKRKSDEGILQGRIGGVALASVANLGTGLAKGTDGGSMVASARTNLKNFVAKTDDKKQKGKNENTETFDVSIGGIHLTVTMPVDNPKDEVAALRETKVSYGVAKDGAKTSGTVATGFGKASLKKLASNAKDAAKEGQDDKFTARGLELARDKAVAAAERNAKGDDSKADKKEVQAIMQGHNANLRISRALSDFSADCIKAQLACVGAHL